MGNIWILLIKQVCVISNKFTFGLYATFVHASKLFSGKEARKKELKKNKRQRQMVRAAVLKNKDPGQILEEMEKIDEMGL